MAPPPANPFLAAFFRSPSYERCGGLNDNLLLIPTITSITNAVDLETDTSYIDLLENDEFIASHIIKLSDTSKSGPQFPISRGDIRLKAKQFVTLNNRSIVVKDNHVFTNQGFKSLVQAAIVSDAVYLTSTYDNRRWQVYYIARPLVGLHHVPPIVPASIKRAQSERSQNETASAAPHQSTIADPSRALQAVKEILAEYPMIARQLGVTTAIVIERYNVKYESSDSAAPVGPPSVRSSKSSASLRSSVGSLRSSLSNEPVKSSLSTITPGESAMRIALEAPVYAALDTLDYLDEHQLNILLSAVANDRSALELALERYVTEQLHDEILYPQLCSTHRRDDMYLASRLRKMSNIDIAQVGIPIEGGRAGKRELALRLDNAVASFKKIANACTPQEMIEILLATIRAVTTGTDAPAADDTNDAEKHSLAMTINADSLVSMLLLIVIKSSVKHLHASLSYMRNFVLLGDIELGETGYALSTLEAVLAYLDADSDHLCRASKTNTRLWTAIRAGDLAVVCDVLQTDHPQHQFHDQVTSATTLDDSSPDDSSVQSLRTGHVTTPHTHVKPNLAAAGASLSHVFPFQRPPTPPPETPRRKQKRVSMADSPSRSVSCDSSKSHSRRASATSIASLKETDDTTSAKLVQTQNQNGDSLLMMAIDSGQHNVLRFFLSSEELFSPAVVLSDSNSSDCTLLLAAFQTGDKHLIETMLDYARDHLTGQKELSAYIMRQDNRGRCIAHFLGVHPSLLPQLGQHISWTVKDKSGHTPLSTLCRTYDLAEYEQTINQALDFAAAQQGDDLPLHTEDHTDNKGNTLLHSVNNASLTARLLFGADVDVNAVNDRRFTPLMTASKYGKHDVVSCLLADARVDLEIRDLRGLSATELAKDDSARRRLDHMVMFSRRPEQADPMPTIVRSFFVDDGSYRMVIEAMTSGSGTEPGDVSTAPVSCRRSLRDFQDLLSWLAIELPACWVPSCSYRDILSPFAHPARPSRAVLMDTQQRLDRLLRLLLTHATFATHELVWEFFLVPDLNFSQLSDRTQRKAELRMEKIREDTEPLTDVSDVEIFVRHAQDQTRRLLDANRRLLRSTDRHLNRTLDIASLAAASASSFSTLLFVPETHKEAYTMWAKALAPSSTESVPMWTFHYDIDSVVSATTAVSVALLRPVALIQRINSTRKEMDKTLGSLSRSSRWTPKLALFDETRRALADEAAMEAEKSRVKEEYLGAELRYSQQMVASELAGWHEARTKIGRDALRDLASRSLVREKDRLAAMKRALRRLTVSRTLQID